MANKFYVVWAGRKTGIFTSWDETKAQVDKFPKARYKSFKTRAEATAAFKSGTSPVSARTSSTDSRKKNLNSAVASSDSKKSPAGKVFDVEIYTDGGCEPNPGKAGSGLALYRSGALSELWYGLYNAYGTNNTAELNALHQALLLAKDNLASDLSVHILSDSQYSINCISNWAYGWKTKGWKRQKAGDIKNLEIIQASHALYDAMKDKLVLSHVSAHVGIEGNELADRMSIYAIDKQDVAFCRYLEPIDLAAILGLRTG